MAVLTEGLKTSDDHPNEIENRFAEIYLNIFVRTSYC